MRLAVSLIIVGVTSVAMAEDARPEPAAVKATIDRGLGFLVKDALAWKEQYKCASCHHAGLVVWSMREAKQRGHAVDEPVLAELTKWIAEDLAGDPNPQAPAPGQLGND